MGDRCQVRRKIPFCREVSVFIVDDYIVRRSKRLWLCTRQGKRHKKNAANLLREYEQLDRDRA